MRIVPLFISPEIGDFIHGLNDSGAAVFAPFVINDTIQFAARKVVAVDQPAATLFKETPWLSPDGRVSVGLIGGAPDSGTFKLTVGANTSAAITWPGASALATSDQITAWKATVLAALLATTGVGAGAAVSSDPRGTPAHLLYFTWTDAAKTDVITVTACALAPLIIPQTLAQTPAPGYQQLIRLCQAAIKETVDFTLVEQTAPTITQQRAGTTGVNALQRLTIADKTAGSISLAWSGSITASLAVPGVTAAQLATALNAIVANGTTNPSFAVTAVPGGLATFDIEFIGPLAGAAQALLTVALLASVEPTVATATLDLAHPRFARILNGAGQATLQLEFVDTDGSGGEFTIVRDILLEQDLTNGSDAAALEAADAVMHITDTLVVTSGSLTPFASVAPGAAFTPIAAVSAGTTINIDHELGTWFPNVLVFYRDGTTPESWRRMGEGEYGYEVPDTNHVNLTFPFDITNSGTATDTYDISRIKVFIASPDAAISIFGNVTIPWDNVLQSLPSGQSLTAKLAAIDAALGIIGGTLQVQAANITGSIAPAQLDLAALIKAILAFIASDGTSMNEFLALLTSAQVIQAITGAQVNATNIASFIAALTAAFNSSNATDLLSTVSTALLANTTFQTSIRGLVLSILQGSAILPDGWIVWIVPAVSAVVQPWQEIPGVPLTIAGTAQTTTGNTTVAGGTTTTSSIVQSVPTTSTQATTLKFYSPLSPAITSPNAGTNRTGELPATGTAGNIDTVITAPAFCHDTAGRRGVTFAVGAKITFANGHWYEVVQIGSTIYYAVEYECEVLPPVIVNAAQLYRKSQLVIQFAVRCELQNDSLIGRCSGWGEIVVEAAAPSADATDDISTIAWATIFTLKVNPDRAAVTHNLTVKVQRANDDTLTGQIGAYGQLGNFTPASANNAYRARFTRFDCTNITEPRGTLLLTQTGAVASISPQS